MGCEKKSNWIKLYEEINMGDRVLLLQNLKGKVMISFPLVRFTVVSALLLYKSVMWQYNSGTIDYR